MDKSRIKSKKKKVTDMIKTGSLRISYCNKAMDTNKKIPIKNKL
jgi:hypothetical protein